jgi:hypothetical protein
MRRISPTSFSFTHFICPQPAPSEIYSASKSKFYSYSLPFASSPHPLTVYRTLDQHLLLHSPLAPLHRRALEAPPFAFTINLCNKKGNIILTRLQQRKKARRPYHKRQKRELLPLRPAANGCPELKDCAPGKAKSTITTDGKDTDGPRSSCC